jgi:hypothetical protein
MTADVGGPEAQGIRIFSTRSSCLMSEMLRTGTANRGQAGEATSRTCKISRVQARFAAARETPLHGRI